MSRQANENKVLVQRRLHWDCRETAKSYVNTASVLAGFAFAAVVLVVQSVPPNSTNSVLLRDWASIAFLIGFFGCIVASFTFSVVAGEEEIVPRTFTLMLLGGGGFAVSGVYIFWGLAVLINLFLTPQISSVAEWIFGGILILSPMYLILAVIDIFMSFDGLPSALLKVPVKLWLQLSAMGYLPVGLGLLLRVTFSNRLAFILSSFFGQLVFISLVLIVLGNGFAVWISNARSNFRLSVTQSAWWIFLHSCVFGLLSTLLP